MFHDLCLSFERTCLVPISNHESPITSLLKKVGNNERIWFRDFKLKIIIVFSD
jgi:hypothetical protein